MLALSVAISRKYSSFLIYIFFEMYSILRPVRGYALKKGMLVD